MIKIEDQNILITGASGGVGLEVAKQLLRAGVKKLALNYRSNPEKLFSLCREHGLDPEAVCFRADLTKEDEVKKLRTDIESQMGKVNSVIGFAGATSNAMSWKLSLEDFRKVVDANFTSTFLVNREFIPAMRENNFGRIINVSSVVAQTGVAGASHYCGSKAAIIGFSKALAQELASKKVTVNVVALGYFEYGMINTVPQQLQEGIKSKIPLNRFGQANEISALVQFLLSPDASYMTGQVLNINGGLYG